jgi:hypothetical protein
MVIGPGKNGIAAFVILADGEYLPANLNSIKVVVFRQGDSTGRELKMVKPLGELAEPGLLKPPAAPVCNLPEGATDPLHQHEDGTWWYYDVTWQLEEGPYNEKAEAYSALGAYCLQYQNTLKKDLTRAEEIDKLLSEREQEGK